MGRTRRTICALLGATALTAMFLATIGEGSSAAPAATGSVSDVRSDLNRIAGLTWLRPHGPLRRRSSGTLFFSANDGAHGCELWKSDGTDAGTVLVKDINPGSTGFVPRQPDERRTGRCSSRPTTARTAPSCGRATAPRPAPSWSRTSIRPGTVRAGTSSPTVGRDAVLRGRRRHARHELWKSDGTAAGTVLVKDICPGSVRAPLQLADQRQRDAVLRGQRRHARAGAVEERRHGGRHRPGQGHPAGRRLGPTRQLHERRRHACTSWPTTARTGTSCGRATGRRPAPCWSRTSRPVRSVRRTRWLTNVGRDALLLADDGTTARALEERRHGRRAPSWSRTSGLARTLLSELPADVDGTLFFAANDGIARRTSSGRATGRRPAPSWSRTSSRARSSSPLRSPTSTARSSSRPTTAPTATSSGRATGRRPAPSWSRTSSPARSALRARMRSPTSDGTLYFAADDGAHGERALEERRDRPRHRPGQGHQPAGAVSAAGARVPHEREWRRCSSAHRDGERRDCRARTVDAGTERSKDSHRVARVRRRSSAMFLRTGRTLYRVEDGARRGPWRARARSRTRSCPRRRDRRTDSSSSIGRRGLRTYRRNCELWKSDGTAAGPSWSRTSAPVDGLRLAVRHERQRDAVLRGHDDGMNGVELWKSDGTAAGHRHGEGHLPGSDGSYPVDRSPT